MQIVIDIDKETLNNIRFFGLSSSKDRNNLLSAIKNGTPLPEHHGRLIDYGYVVDAIDDWINAEEYNYTNATDYLRTRIRNVPTIIEAEGSDEE